jgi:hypothetical protein
MRPGEPSIINQIQLYRPLCSKCGTLTQLARLEPCDDPDAWRAAMRTRSP